MIPSLLDYLDASPCNFWAIATAKQMLDQAGFVERRLDSPMNDVKPGDRFYVTKNDTALFAVKVGTAPLHRDGVRLVAAHSDSPCFRVKPQAPMVSADGYLRLNTEVYGGPILYTWFDRPLSLAGRVITRGDDALHPETRLVNLKRPLLAIPHLAIHFNRAVNEGNPLSRQRDMMPLLGVVGNRLEADNLLPRLLSAELGVAIDDIIDFDLMLYDVQPASRYGLDNDLISSGRLDDLSMVHAGLTALITSSNPSPTCVTAIFDNEETGSGTKQGAGSPLLATLLQRVNAALGGDLDRFAQTIERSFMISADNAHAFHPNYPEKYDPTNHPVLGGGPCVKINANCKYMTDAHSSAIFRQLCVRAGVPCQSFVNHSDVAGGSTLGNILTGQLEIEGVDVGNPLLAMHSVRETASARDHEAMTRVMTTFFDL